MLRGARVLRRRTLLRAAAVGGLAHRARTRVEPGPGRRARCPPPVVLGSPPAPASLPAPAMQARLKLLGELDALRERGALSDEEFAQQKQRVLEG